MKLNTCPAQTSAGVELLRGKPRAIALHTAKLRRLPWLLAAAGLISLPAFAEIAAATLPTGGVVAAGNAAISQSGAAMRIDQTSNKAVIDWQSFNIGRDASVRFNQPSSSAITLNRVGADGGRSIIDGSLSANGQVWLLNPGGVLFSSTARVDVGGLLSSSLKLGNDDFMSGIYRFGKDGAGSIVNQGTLNAADGGYIALMAPEVRNEGVISARLGTVALASGDELRVDFSGDRLIEIAVDKATVNGLIENKNLVEADGGLVLMSTDAASRLSDGAINNSGVVRATTLSEQGGVIKLLGGTVNVAGTLDASAPNGGDGGFIETSGHTVNVDSATRVTTAAPQGKTGNWLIDPNDYTIAASGGDITGAALSSNLGSTSVTIQTATMGTPGGNGDIFVNDSVSWNSGNTLSLQAERNININANITGSGAGTLLRLQSGGDISVPYYSGFQLTVPNLAVRSAGNVDLFGTYHAVDNLAVSMTGIGKTFRFHNGNTLTIGTVDGLSGITNNGDVRINIEAGDLAVTNNINASGAVMLETPGTLTISGTAIVSGSNNVAYYANDMTLIGNTTTPAGGDIVIAARDASRQVRIEATPTAGVLSLTPAELATLQTPAGTSGSLVIDSGSANLTVATGLASNQLNADYVHLMGANVAISAPVTASGVLTVRTPGTLTVSANVTGTGPGGAGGPAVTYSADNMVLTGTTTAIAGSPEIYTYTPTRSIRIEATPTAGVLSLTPAEIATLHADADRDMVLHTLNGDITVASALAGNQINSGYLNLKAPGGNITVDAPITGGSGMGGMFIQAGQNVTINAPVDAGAGMIIVQTLGDNQLFTLTGSGSLTSTYSGPIMPDACGNSVAICVNSGRMTIDGTITANNQAVLLATGTDRAVVLGVDDNQCRQHRRRHPGADQRRTESNSRQHLGGCQRLHEWSRQ